MVVVVVAAVDAACPDGAGEGHQLELKTLRIVKTYLSLDVYPPAQMFYSTQENFMI